MQNIAMTNLPSQATDARGVTGPIEVLGATEHIRTLNLKYYTRRASTLMQSVASFFETI